MAMDFASAVKSDVLTPLLTYVIPGAFAVAPYVLITHHYLNQVAEFSEAHPTAYSAILILIVIAIGAVLEELGTRLELAWDKRMQLQLTNWEDYLKLKLKDEIIAQRYLRVKLIRMKFELSMVVALLFFLSGFTWLNFIASVWEWPSFTWMAGVTVVVIIYLAWESYESAKLLHTTRNLVIKGAMEARAASSG